MTKLSIDSTQIRLNAIAVWLGWFGTTAKRYYPSFTEVCALTRLCSNNSIRMDSTIVSNRKPFRWHARCVQNQIETENQNNTEFGFRLLMCDFKSDLVQLYLDPKYTLLITVSSIINQHRQITICSVNRLSWMMAMYIERLYPYYIHKTCYRTRKVLRLHVAPYSMAPILVRNMTFVI